MIAMTLAETFEATADLLVRIIMRFDLPIDSTLKNFIDGCYLKAYFLKCGGDYHAP